MSGWTKGPWRVDPRAAADVQTADGSMEIVTVWNGGAAGVHLRCPSSAPSKEESHANAHLIAAAPDLAEALEKLLAEHLDLASRADCLEWAEAEPSPVIAARAALAKARGETP